MKFLIGQVPQEDVYNFGDEGLFEYDGDLFYNQVEIGTNPGGTDDFVISDGIGRSVPISTEHLPALINTLTTIQSYIETIHNGKLAEDALAEDEVYVGFCW